MKTIFINTENTTRNEPDKFVLTFLRGFILKILNKNNGLQNFLHAKKQKKTLQKTRNSKE